MRFTNTIQIAKSVEIVYNYLIHPKNMSNWVNNFVSYRNTNRLKRSKIGAKGILIYEDVQGKFEVEEEIIEIIINKKIVTQLSQKGMQSTVTTKLYDQGESTKLIIDTDIKVTPWIASLFAYLMKGRMQKEQAADYRCLKQQLENA